MTQRPQLSIVIIEFNMAREIPRTVFSLSPAFQRGIERDDYELILIDNGSDHPSDHDTLSAYGAQLSCHRIDGAGPSPVIAINHGLKLARGEMICVMIDGARMASPGLLAHAIRASRLHPRPIISPLGFHLGLEPQNSAAKNGYNQAAEDALLATVDWMHDGYRLFDIAVVAPGQAGGWFRPLAESTALFMPADMWAEIGGFDERFATPGGGLANLDAYDRACRLPATQPIMLLGEATFHQFHGGIASNSTPGNHPWEQFHKEYIAIRGHPFKKPEYNPACYGTIGSHILRLLEPGRQERV